MQTSSVFLPVVTFLLMRMSLQDANN